MMKITHLTAEAVSPLLIEGSSKNPLLLSGAKSRFFSGRGVDADEIGRQGV